MEYFMTSDTHFGHANIIKYCNRPFKSVKEMDNILIKNWNSVVSDEDIVFHLGDFSFERKDSYKYRLNGDIILIKGNHDTDSIIDRATIYYKGAEYILIHNPTEAREGNILCGHVHEKWKCKVLKTKTCLNVGVDVWDYFPINLKQIHEEVKKWNQKRK